MTTLLIYSVKAAAFLIAFYLVYSILLCRDTTYIRNRAFIIFSLISSLILPFFTFYTVKPLDIQFFGKFLSDVFITATSTGTKPLNVTSSFIDILQIMNSIYIAGVFVFVLKLITNILNLLYLIARQKNEGSRIIRFHGFNTAGFSAIGYIFINTRLSPEEAGEIIRHEQNHLKQNHFIDIVFVELIIAFQWFNPVVYLFSRSLRAIHEYQADEGCLSSGVPIVNYQSLLLSQVFKSKAFNLTNSFSNPSLIKKRMIMMTKKRTAAFANVKLLIVVPVVGIVLLAISAYREIPDLPDKQIIAQHLNVLPNPSLPYPSSIASTEPSKVPVNRENRTSSIVTRPETVPPPPPPPQNSTPEMKQVPVVVEDTSAEFEEAPFVVVEEMPMFPGGDVELLKFIAANTVYPEVAKEKNIQGRVIVRFSVTSKGSVNKISILKGVSPLLDTEAIRVVKTLPDFKPGKQGGKAVPVWYMVPITFTLK
ncbi:MAG TPA: M56 family metallopeptidase [Bacteroidales bacterium]